MPAQVHYHPGGLVYVRTDSGAYENTLEGIRTDSGIDVPVLPEGVTERLYIAGQRHALINGPDVVAGGPMPWDVGDTLIASIDVLLATQNARAQAAEQARLDELEAAVTRGKQPT